MRVKTWIPSVTVHSTSKCLDFKRRASIIQHIGRTLAQLIASTNVGERRSRAGVTGKVLQDDDVGSAFVGGRECSDSKRVDGGGWIKVEIPSALLHDRLDRFGSRIIQGTGESHDHECLRESSDREHQAVVGNQSA